jgi:hypothetical protein
MSKKIVIVHGLMDGAISSVKEDKGLEQLQPMRKRKDGSIRLG